MTDLVYPVPRLFLQAGQLQVLVHRRETLCPGRSPSGQSLPEQVGPFAGKVRNFPLYQREEMRPCQGPSWGQIEVVEWGHQQERQSERR